MLKSDAFDHQIEKLKNKLFINPIAKRETLELIQTTGNFNIVKQKPPVYIILPNSRGKKLWDFLMLLIILWNLFIMPLDIGWNLECFTENQGAVFRNLYTATTIFFLIDICFSCITAVLDEKNNYIYNIEQIIPIYLSSNFFVDLMCCLPFDRVITFSMKDCFQPYVAPGKKYLMLSFIRIFKMSKLLSQLERDFSRYSVYIKFCKLFGFILFFSHLVGNLFSGNSPTYSSYIFVSCSQFSNNSPEALACARNLMSTNFSSVYFFSLYIGIILSFGNDTTTQASWEMVVLMAVTVICTITNASIYGNVAVMLNNMGFGVSPILRQKLDVMKEYMNFMKIDERFIDQIEEYHVNIWLKQRNMMYEDNFLSDMSLALQRILLLEQWNKDFFKNSKLVTNISDYFTLDMIPLLKPKIFMNNDIIITEGDSNIEVFFIPRTGVCQIKIGGVFVNTMTDGDYFGEIAVFLRSRRRTATVICMKDSDFLLLEGKTFEKLLKDFPDDHKVIKKFAINRLLDSMKLYPNSLFAKLVPNNNLKDYMFRKCIYLENEEEDALFNVKKSKNLMDFSLFNLKVGAVNDKMHEVKEVLDGLTKILFN